MKYTLITLILLCSMKTFAQLNAFYVTPNSVNNSYVVGEDSNYVVTNPSVPPLNKLLVFLPGTGAKPKHYLLFPNLAANLGYHCINLTYPNGYPTVAMLCAGNSNADCYANLRQEVCYGTPVSEDVDVDSLNSINTRLYNTLSYLAANYPSQNWGQFLSGNTMDWSKIAISGHSQGGGHALYFAKTQSCERMIMFAGADDYSNYYSQPANWTFVPGQTSTGKYFSFLHLNDDVWDYAKQYAVVQATGMTANDDSTLVDYLNSPYNNSHCLYTTVTPLYPGIYSAEHNGTVVDYFTPRDGNNDPLYTPVWTYMLSDEVAEVQSKNEMHLSLYPNPATKTINIGNSSLDPFEIIITTELGQIIHQDSGNNLSIDCSAFPAGLYFIYWKNAMGKSSCEKIIIE